MGDPAQLKLNTLRLYTVDTDTRLFNVAHASYLADTFNASGKGSGRFSPIVSDTGNTGHLYLGSTRIAALLETAFHEIGPGRTNTIDAANHLSNWFLRTFAPRRSLKLIDLRNEALRGMGLDRESLISSSPAHYRCTRSWATRLRTWGRRHDGFIWQSRIAEIAATRSPMIDALQDTSFAEALVLYDDHLQPNEFDITASPDDLASPSQRALVDEMAHLLDVAIL